MVPNFKHEVERARGDYPQAWKDAHTGSARTEDFIRILAARLHRFDPKFGLNGKRGNPLDISDDVVIYKGEGIGYDPTNGNAPVTVIDVIGGAGAPGATVQWVVFNDTTNPDHLGPSAWVDPITPPAPKPAPAPPKPAYPGDRFFVDSIGKPLEEDYRKVNQTLNAGSASWFARTIWRVVNEGMTPEQSLAISQPQWRKALDPNGTIQWN